MSGEGKLCLVQIIRDFENPRAREIRILLFITGFAKNPPLPALHFILQPTSTSIRELKQWRWWQLRKRHLKSEFALLQTLSRLFHLVKLDKRGHFFLGLNSKRLCWSSGKEKESHCLVFTSRSPQNMKLHVGIFMPVMQWRKEMYTKCDVSAELFYQSKPILLFGCSRWRCCRRCVSSLLTKYVLCINLCLCPVSFLSNKYLNMHV